MLKKGEAPGVHRPQQNVWSSEVLIFGGEAAAVIYKNRLIKLFVLGRYLFRASPNYGGHG